MTTVFARYKGTSSTNINIAVNVGTRVPRNVTLVETPEDIVVIVPHYRSYKYFIVAEKVIIVDPDTYEIVEILIIA